MMSESDWTEELNNVFEQALAIYEDGTPDRWQKVARAVGGGRSAEDMIRHYEYLQRDVHHIETTPQPGESSSSRSKASGSGSSSKEKR